MSAFTTTLMSSSSRRNLFTGALAMNNKVSLRGIVSIASSSSGPIPSPTAATNHPSRTNPAAARHLSTHGQEAVERFQEALEEYRVKNYAQTIPPRFKKEILNVINASSSSVSSSASLSSSSSSIPIDDQKTAAVKEIEQFLQNIGVFGDQVTHDDVEIIVSEIGESKNHNVENIQADKIVTGLL